jgi:plasmid maintenance system antidote protein VapI
MAQWKPAVDLLRQRLATPEAQAAFAQRIGCTERHLLRVLAGHRPPPLDDATDWASALHLSDSGVRRYVVACACAHTHPWTTERIVRLESLLDRYEQWYRGIRDTTDLGPDMLNDDEMAELRREIDQPD